MGIFDGVLLCCDVDGTLVHEGKVAEQNLEAIEYFKKEGGLFTLSTGRYPEYFTENFSVKPNTYVVSVNGTVVSDVEGKEILYDKKLDYAVIKDVEKNIISRYELQTYWSADITHHTMPFGTIVEGDANKIVMVPYTEQTALELMSELEKRYSSVALCNRSWPTGVELIPIGSGKGECVRLLKKITGASLLVCAGDYENDVSMLKEADIGYAIKSGVAAAHKAADRITKKDAKDGAVAEIIYELSKEIQTRE